MGSDGDKNSWRNSTAIAIVITVADLALLFFPSQMNDFKFPEEARIGGIGLITFFGMLILSSYHKKSILQGDDKDRGVMRDALAGSLIAVYFIVLGYGLYNSSSITGGGQNVLSAFSDVIMVLIGFYFGSKGALQVYQAYKNSKTSDSGSDTGNGSKK
jgi:hypothetical protein